MIYAVNKRTREHRRANASNTSGWTSPYCNWSVVMADADGWIEWHGGELPLPYDAPVEVVRRGLGLDVMRRDCAGTLTWRDMGNDYTIIAYRPILDAKPDAPAWDGEGLPPVGCECEAVIDASQGFEWCRPIAYHGDMVWLEARARHPVRMVSHCRFRPLRSAEDREVDDALCAIGADRGDRGYAEGVVLRMIRAGYRKTATADGEE